MKSSDPLALICAQDKPALLRAAKEQTPSHAYLFTGAADGLLREAAYRYLSLLLSAEPQKRELLFTRLTDGLYSDAVEVDKEGQSVKVEQVRRACAFLSLKPQEGNYKIALIRSCESMTEVAQNALLKTLEEPAEGAVLILAAQSLDNLLPTVLSRVQTVRVIPGAESSFAPVIEPFVREQMEELLLTGEDSAIFRFAAYLTKQKGDTAAYLMQLDAYFQEIIYYKSTGKTRRMPKEEIRLVGGKISGQCAVHISEAVRAALRHLKQNASPQLAVEAMLIRIQEECHAENSWS